MIKRWNTIRFAWWGVAFGAWLGVAFGAMYAPLRTELEGNLPRFWNREVLFYLVTSSLGGAVAGAILFASVSGVRNLILRAK